MHRLPQLRNLLLRFSSLMTALLLLVSAPLPVSAERAHKATTYEALKATYQTLRNTDPGIAREGEWRKLAADFEALGASNSGDASSALYHAALLEQEIFTVLGDGRAGDKAIALYDSFATKYPASPLADDALLRLGEILNSRGKEEEAEQTFARLRRSYPQSELNAVATAVLEGADDAKDEGRADEPVASAPYAGNRPIIVIDPGHGGEDFGAMGQGGLLEKDVALSVSFEVAESLRKLGAIVRLTREKDIFVPLAERTAFANDSSADLFVSIHANASEAKSAGKFSGVESYFLDNSNDQSSKLLAERENASMQFEGGSASDLGFMLSDLMQSSKLGESKLLAQELQSGVVRSVGISYGKINDLGVKKAPFYVLVGAHMPSALVEISFIDNPVEGKNLAEKRYRRAVALGIVEGIQRYLKSHRGTR